MRVAVGAFMQETNDFSQVPTTKETFEAWGVLRGDEITADRDLIQLVNPRRADHKRSWAQLWKRQNIPAFVPAASNGECGL